MSSWNRPSLLTIYNRIKTNMEIRLAPLDSSGIPLNLKILPVSFLGVCAAVWAGSEHSTYGFLEFWKKQFFMDIATLFGLTRWGNILKVPQQGVVITEGVVQFFGTTNIIVPKNTILVNSNGYEYLTKEDFEIGVDPSVDVIANMPYKSENGEDWNTDELNLTLSSPIEGVSDSVLVVAGFSNGQNKESLIDWRERIRFSFRNPPGCGNDADYINWVKAASPYAKKVWVWGAEQWLGGGSVGIAVNKENMEPLSNAQLDTIRAYIEAVRPIPASVSIFSGIPIPVQYSISISPNTLDLRNSVQLVLTNLHLKEAYPGGTVLLAHVHNVLATAGLNNYTITDIQVNGESIGATSDITSVRPYIPNFGSIIFETLV